MNTQEVLSDALQRKLGELKNCSYSALKSLPPSSREDIPKVMGGGLQIWIEDEQGQLLKVTVLAYKNYLLGIGTSQLGGFRVSKNGLVADLKPDELE